MPGIFDMSPPSTSIPLPFFFIRAWHRSSNQAKFSASAAKYLLLSCISLYVFSVFFCLCWPLYVHLYVSFRFVLPLSDSFCLFQFFSFALLIFFLFTVYLLLSTSHLLSYLSVSYITLIIIKKKVST